jgi:hypothetical protein
MGKNDDEVDSALRSHLLGRAVTVECASSAPMSLAPAVLCNDVEHSLAR